MGQVTLGPIRIDLAAGAVMSLKSLPPPDNGYLLYSRLNIGLKQRKKEDSRKGAKHAEFGETGNISSLRSWRLGARRFLEVVLSKISNGRIYSGNFSQLQISKAANA